MDNRKLIQWKIVKKAGFIIIAGLVILCAAIMTLVFVLNGSPKSKVLHAISKTLTTGDTTLENYLHIASYRKLMATGRLHTNMDLHLADIEMGASNPELENIVTLAPRITVDSLMNYNDKKLLSNVDIGMGGSNVFQYKVYADDSVIAMECPLLYDGALSFDSSTLSEDYNGSALAAMLNTPPLDHSMNFNLFEGALSDQTFMDLYKSIYSEDLSILYESIVVTKTDDAEIQLGDHAVKARGYTLSIPGTQLEAAYNNALSLLEEQSTAFQTGEWNAVTFPETFLCTVYIDPSSKEMIRLVHSDDYTFKSEAIHMNLHIDWTDITTPMDHMKMEITCTEKEQQKYILTFHTTGQKNEDTYEKELLLTLAASDIDESPYDPLRLLFSYKISPDNDTFQVSSYLEKQNEDTPMYDFSVAGSFADISAGKSLSIIFHSIALQVPSESFDLELSGDYSMNAYDGEISSPESLRPILSMDEDGLSALLYEALRNVSNSSMFGSIFQ